MPQSEEVEEGVEPRGGTWSGLVRSWATAEPEVLVLVVWREVSGTLACCLWAETGFC